MFPPPPQTPLAHWPVQLAISSGYICYTEPGAFVTQSYIEHATLEGTQAMTLRVDSVLRAHREELEQLGGLLIIHDWRSLKSWDADARHHLIQRSKDRPRGAVRHVVVALSTNPFLRMAAQVINLMMSAIGGAGLQVVDAIGPSLTRFSVKTPPRSARLPAGLAE